MKSIVLFLIASTLACGGTLNTGDAGTDASTNDSSSSDTGTDAPYAACFDATGQLDYSLKTCQGDGDCVIKQEQTDCCGTILYVGVNQSSTSAFDTCEAAWVSHFPGCGCASGQTKTEDGKTTYPNADATAPAIHCTDFTSNGGVCLTYTP